MLFCVFGLKNSNFRLHFFASKRIQFFPRNYESKHEREYLLNQTFSKELKLFDVFLKPDISYKLNIK